MTCIQRLIQNQPSEDRKAYIKGLIDAAEWFGVWKDGEQQLGIGDTTLKEFKEEVGKA